MSGLGRAMLRLAAVATLRGQTLVGDEVYDSRIAALDPETFMPNIGEIAGSIGVYTEQESGDALSSANGGPPFRPEIDLVIEIAMQAKFRDGDAFIIDTPTTDDELELTLDAIDAQVEMALFPPVPLRDEARALYKLTKDITGRNAIRFTNPESSDKRAMRYVTYKIEILDELLPMFEASFVDDPDQPLLRLPKRWRDVVALWPADSVETEKVSRLAEILVPPTIPKLQRVDVSSTPPGSIASPVTAQWGIPQS